MAKTHDSSQCRGHPFNPCPLPVLICLQGVSQAPGGGSVWSGYKAHPHKGHSKSSPASSSEYSAAGAKERLMGLLGVSPSAGQGTGDTRRSRLASTGI